MIAKSIGAVGVWRIKEFNGQRYSSITTSFYFDFLSKNFEKVYIISDYEKIDAVSERHTIVEYPNVTYVPIRKFTNYLNGQRCFPDYYKAIKSICDKVDYFYCRVPDNFSWLPALMGEKSILHFVGDTIDATKHNEKWSALHKGIMIAGYYPDYLMTLISAKRSKVYTNGFHLKEKLSRYGVEAQAVISSTVLENEIPESLHALSNDGSVRLVNVGYIRNAKGIRTIMSLIKLLKKTDINFRFDIVGDGEMLDDLQTFVNNDCELRERVVLHGRINDRDRLNAILRDSDLFIFPSLSEGSPRVVIEAMAQGVPVVSTPVGSLPSTFKDHETIRFFDFNDAEQALEIIREFISDSTPFENMRKEALTLVRENFTRDMFMKKIFTYET